MRALRVLYFPLYYHKIMERFNLLHYGLNAYTRELMKTATEGYPMLTNREILIDSRDDRIIEPDALERTLISI